MNEKKKARLKDNILMQLSIDKTKSSVYEIADTLKQNVRLITYLSEELEKDGLVRLIDVSSKTRAILKEYVLGETNKGIYFLTFDGGHLQKYKQTRIQTIWIIVKTTAAIINAVAIIAIGIYSLYLSDKSNRLEKENEKLRIEIQQNK